MELIKIYQGNIISARELHTFLKVKSRFNDWINNRIKKYEFQEKSDYTKILVQLVRGQEQYDFLLSITMAKELCMVENNELGKEARRYFIKAEQTLQVIKNNKRMEAFSKLEASKERLLSNIKNIGGTENDYIQIDFEGKMVLFNGKPMEDVELPLILLKGRDFATELTNEGFKAGIADLEEVENLNKKNHKEVRVMIKQNTNMLPENMNPEKPVNNKNIEE
ncbi:antA/AntB antirepressor family protein [Flexithrix dorotheae]|uniref:antA/AntB antirepressor family protein n=1 Tax=Flexithrix dorotheae TaxID=70993 RepID=UPI0003A59D0F|nr:antA/AntB antirepressor family protein [Flexithrix dorotheae]